MELERTDALLFRVYLFSNAGLLVLTAVWASAQLWSLRSVLSGAWYAMAGFGVLLIGWLAISYARRPARECIWLAVGEHSE